VGVRRSYLLGPPIGRLQTLAAAHALRVRRHAGQSDEMSAERLYDPVQLPECDDMSAFRTWGPPRVRQRRSAPAQQHDDAGELREGEEVCRVVLVARDQASDERAPLVAPAWEPSM
jgi:hypothetical protein